MHVPPLLFSESDGSSSIESSSSDELETWESLSSSSDDSGLGGELIVTGTIVVKIKFEETR